MFYKNAGLPKVGELVYCTVKSVQRGGVFVNLEEYSTDAILPIPEVSPGRIRNLREYVKPGKKIVCVVLYVNSSNSHVTVSLRRVSDKARREKLDRIKQEITAESVVKFLASKLEMDAKELYNLLMNSISKDYDSLFDFFMDVVEGNAHVSDYVKDKKIAETTEEEIISKIKPRLVKKKMVVEIHLYDNSGVNRIRRAFEKVMQECEKYKDDENRLEVESIYLGSGKYEVKAVAKEFSTVNDVLDHANEILSSEFEDKPDVVYKSEILKGEKIN